MTVGYLSVYLQREENLGREVVGVSSGPHARREGAERIAAILALLLFEEVFVEHQSVAELKPRFALRQQVVVHHYLVKEVPSAAIGVRAYAVVELLPEGVVEAAGLHLFFALLAAHHHSAAFVERVVVEVAHHNDAYVGVNRQQAVGYVVCECGGRFAQPARLSFAAAAVTAVSSALPPDVPDVWAGSTV